MGLEDVVQDILGKAKSDSAAAVRAGNEKAGEIIKKAEADVLIRELHAGEDIARIKESAERKEVADAALLSKKALQNVKKELIERAYAGLNEMVSGMAWNDRRKMLGMLLKKCMSEIGDIGAVYANKKDMQFVSSLVKSRKISVRQENIIGGVIAESADRKFRSDNSFDRFIERIRETRAKELSKILF